MSADKGLYVRVNGAWLKVFGGTDPNAPGAPTNVVRVGNVITFDAGTPGPAGPTLSYVADINPKGPTLKFDDGIDPSVGGKLTITDGVADAEYTVEIFGVNTAGRGAGVTVGPFEWPFNAATGGSISTVNNYRDSGQTWRVHIFTSSSTFAVQGAVKPFKCFLQGGGAGGGYGTGGGRGVYFEGDLTIPVGSHAITVGSAVSGGYNEVTNRSAPGNNGKPSSISNIKSVAGGVSRGAVVGAGAQSYISGSLRKYGGSGGADSINNDSNIGGYPGGGRGATNGSAASWPGGGGGGGQWGSGGGARGEIVIAYQIG